MKLSDVLNALYQLPLHSSPSKEFMCSISTYEALRKKCQIASIGDECLIFHGYRIYPNPFMPDGKFYPLEWTLHIDNMFQDNEVEECL